MISSLFASIFLSFLLLLSLSAPSLSAKCHPQDKKVLKQIEKAITIPPHFITWTPDTDCCDWYGVQCDPDTNRVYNLYILNGRVVSGQLPDAIGHLPALKYLTIHKCGNLTGPLPQSLTNLTNLSRLKLTWTNLSGPIPSFLSQLKNLESIDLSYNNFSGPIPASLSELQMLNELNLQSNKLTGPIPESLGNIACYIKIAHNQITGKIPRSFAAANCSTFTFSRNKLEGDISFLFKKESALQFVDFSRNLLEFNLSKVEFPDNLLFMDLNHNKIYGNLPVGLTKLELQQFNVSYNRLCGKIPVGGKLQEFDQTTYFHNRCLCGTPLPKCK